MLPPAAQGGAGPPILPAPHQAAPKTVGPPILPAPKPSQVAAVKASQSQKSAAAAYSPPKGAKYAPGAQNFLTPNGGVPVDLGQQQAAANERAQQSAALAQLQHDSIQHLLQGKGMKLSLPTGGGGGGLSIGSILGAVPGASIAAAAPGLLNVGKHLGSELYHLPGTTLTGAEQLGIAIHDDLLHGNLGSLNMNIHGQGGGLAGSETGQVLKKAVQQDPIYRATLGGDPAGALKSAEQHPLPAVLDALGLYGVAGRAAGGAARAAGVDAAQLARSREMAPGIAGTQDVTPFSRNFFTQQVQRKLDTMSKGPVRTKLTERNLVKQVALFHGAEKSQLSQEAKAVATGLKHAKPKDAAAANVTPYIAAQGGGVDTLTNNLAQLHEFQAMHGTNPLLDQHIANLQAALNHPSLNEAAMSHAADVYGMQQVPLEAGKVQFGLHTQPELDRALEKQYALSQMPGTHFMPKDVVSPESRAEVRQLGAQARDAHAQLVQAQKQAGIDLGAHKGASAALADLTKRLPVHPVTDQLANHALDLRSMLEHSRTATKIDNAAKVEAAKANYQAALHEVALAKANPTKIGGLVVEDPAARALTTNAKNAMGASLKSISVRPLKSSEVQAHMMKMGHDPNYVNMVNPERERPLALPSMNVDHTAAGAATGQEYGGKALASGDWRPGWSALTRSQLGDVFKVGAARIDKHFVDRFGLRDENGQHFTQHNYASAAAKYEDKTGLKVKPVVDQTAPHDQNIVLVPKAALKEELRQRALDRPGMLARGAMGLNRGFRDTVLTMSPKLAIMHTVEGTARANLAGSVGFPLNLSDAFRARSALKAMAPADAARLRGLATPGSMAGGTLGLDAEDLGRLAPDASAVRTATAPLRLAARGWHNIAHVVISGQRAIEKISQEAALGVHMRQTLQQWGHSTLDAHTAVTRYADELAKGYANPALAENAAKFLHNTMGQYNNFGSATRWVVTRVAPFAPWYMNAAKLVYAGLPFGHPLKAALLQDIANSNAPAWAASRPRDKNGKVIADESSYVKTGPGHFLDVGKMTPVGLEAGNPLKEAAGLAIPQYQGAIAALTGHDPFWGNYRNATTPYGQSAIQPFDLATVPHAVDQFVQGVGGPIGKLATAAQSNGQTLYNTSMPLFGSVQRKPGTQHGPGGFLGGLIREFNPGYGIYQGSGGKAAPTNTWTGAGPAAAASSPNSQWTGTAPLFGPAKGGGGAEGMNATRGALLANAIQGTGSAAANAANYVAGQVGPHVTPAMTIPAQYLAKQATPSWAQGQWTPAKEGQMLRAQGPAPLHGTQGLSGTGAPGTGAPKTSPAAQAVKDFLTHTTAAGASPYTTMFSLLTKQPGFAPAAPGAGAPAKVNAMQKFADSVVGLPYIWGGGHSGWGKMSGYDCSGFVSAVLHAGGYLNQPADTASLPSQPGMAPGPGKSVTIYDRTAPGTAGHVIIDINGQFYESGGNSQFNPGGGVAKIPKPDAAYLAGFDTVLHPADIGPPQAAGNAPAQGTPAQQRQFVSTLPAGMRATAQKQIAKASQQQQQQASGTPPSVQGLTAKGSALTTPQISAAARIVQIGKQLHAPPTAIEGVIAEAILESGLDPNTPGNPRYGGILAGNVQGTFAPGAASQDAQIRAAFQGGQGFQGGGWIAQAKGGQKDLIAGGGIVSGSGSQFLTETGVHLVPGEAAQIVAALLKMPASSLPSLANQGASASGGSSAASAPSGGGSSAASAPSSGGAAAAPSSLIPAAAAAAPTGPNWLAAAEAALASAADAPIRADGVFRPSNLLGSMLSNAYAPTAATVSLPKAAKSRAK